MSATLAPLDRPASPASTGFIRALTPGDREALVDHLKRLDPDSRRMRFAGTVNEAFLENYAARAIGADSVVKGLFVEGTLRGIAELRFLGADRTEGEGAFSLERAWQGHGHGARLFQSLLDSARNRGVNRLVLQCLRENAAMQTIARRHEAELAFDCGEVVAEIRRPHADAGSLQRERIEERAARAIVAADRALCRLALQAGVDLRRHAV